MPFSGAWWKALVAAEAITSMAFASPLVGKLVPKEGYEIANPMGFKGGEVVPNTGQSDKGYYYFQAFPGSRVPTASVTCIAIPAAFLIIFIATVFVMRAWLHIFSRFSPSLSEDREKALENVRLVGVRFDSESQGADGEKVWSDHSAEKHSDAPSDEVLTTEMGGAHGVTDPAATLVSPAPAPAPPAAPIPVSPARPSEKKLKDMNEISGPVVPVLRSDDPNALSDNEDDSFEEDDDNCTSRYPSNVPSEFNYASQRASAAPSTINFPPPQEENVLDLPKESSEAPTSELAPPIEGSTALPASVSNASTLFVQEATEDKDQNSLFP
ncbi:hypothetical protein MNAN1_000136 [Malassezia nana]|uniref:Uncharacterized protein n=1 Tax=Malassezia nana TaxID=180528 RepID=A0AAF0EGD2_9BASI|nr:hypothetical protein MNAN1_000136 [Malassezia nana]